MHEMAAHMRRAVMCSADSSQHVVLGLCLRHVAVGVVCGGVCVAFALGAYQLALALGVGLLLAVLHTRLHAVRLAPGSLICSALADGQLEKQECLAFSRPSLSALDTLHHLNSQLEGLKLQLGARLAELDGQKHLLEAQGTWGPQRGRRRAAAVVETAGTAAPEETEEVKTEEDGHEKLANVLHVTAEKFTNTQATLPDCAQPESAPTPDPVVVAVAGAAGAAEDGPSAGQSNVQGRFKVTKLEASDRPSLAFSGAASNSNIDDRMISAQQTTWPSKNTATCGSDLE